MNSNYPFHIYINRINDRLVQSTLNKGTGGASLAIFVADFRQIFEMFFPVTTLAEGCI